jgi:nitrogen fixation protein NifX
MLAQRLQLVEPTEPVAGKRLRIAIATQDLKSMNAHFGSARRFAIYDVTSTESLFG